MVGGRAAYLVYLPSAYCFISFLFYGWAQQYTWCTFKRGPPRWHKCLLFKTVFILWSGTAVLLPGVPLTVGPTDARAYCSSSFYSTFGHSGIPGVPPTVGPGSSTQCGPDWIPPWLLVTSLIGSNLGSKKDKQPPYRRLCRWPADELH